MSVVFLNMPMPECCAECPCVNNDAKLCMADYERGTGMGDYNGRPFDIDGRYARQPWCPARDLPENHGRLIDLDALLAHDLGHEKFKSVVRRILLQAPVVLEAAHSNCDKLIELIRQGSKKIKYPNPDLISRSWLRERLGLGNGICWKMDGFYQCPRRNECHGDPYGKIYINDVCGAILDAPCADKNEED